MSGGTDWTPDEIATLHTLRAAGLSMRQCAAKLPGRSYESVRGRLKTERADRGEPFAGAAEEARELGQGRFRDREYVALCLRHGGFIALQFAPRRQLRIAA